MLFPQDALRPPEALTPEQNDIINAARSRAKFWRYPPKSPWTVPVVVGNRTVIVRHMNGEYKLMPESRR